MKGRRFVSVAVLLVLSFLSTTYMLMIYEVKAFRRSERATKAQIVTKVTSNFDFDSYSTLYYNAEAYPSRQHAASSTTNSVDQQIPAINKTLSTLPEYAIGKEVIAVLIANTTNDILMLCNALRSLKFLKGDNFLLAPNPVLVFHEGNLSPDQVAMVVASTTRPIAFPFVDFQSYPAGFDPSKEVDNFARRNKFGYSQMCRFWITTIWKHPVIAPFNLVMRLDGDACYLEENLYLPGLSGNHLVYHSIQRDTTSAPKYCKNLYDVATAYVEKMQITPGNPEMWQDVKHTWAKTNKRKLPLFSNHFEVSRVSFMQREDVMNFTHAMTEEEPFGVFRWRWGDALVRYMTIALFGTKEGVILHLPPGYQHKGCPDVK